jgi:hypothetical protein
MRTRRRKGQLAEIIEAAAVDLSTHPPVTNPPSQPLLPYHTVKTTDPPLFLEYWTQLLGLEQLQSIKNGHYLYYALRNALAINGGDRLTHGTVDDQVEWVKKNILALYMLRLRVEIAGGQMNLPQLYQKLAGATDQEEHLNDYMVDQVEKHIQVNAAISVKDALPARYWGATDELRMAATWLQIDIFVIDRQPDDTAFIARYTPGTPTHDERAAETPAKIVTLTNSEAKSEMPQMLRSGTAILLLRSGENMLSHFTALRLSENGFVSSHDPPNNETSKTESAGPTPDENTATQNHASDANGKRNMDGEANFPPHHLGRYQGEGTHQKGTMLHRFVGTKAEIGQLSVEEDAIRRQRLKQYSDAMEAWIKTVRKNKRYEIPTLQHGDISKLTTWIPSHVESLAALLQSLPYPVEALRGIPYKKLLDFGHAINSQTQLALIKYHAEDEGIDEKPRLHCKKWAAAICASTRGSTRWALSDDPMRWGRLERMDDTLLTATTPDPVETERWAILNVIGVLMPLTFPCHIDVGVVMPEVRTSVYWKSKDIQDIVTMIATTKSWSLMVGRCELDSPGLPTRN